MNYRQITFFVSLMGLIFIMGSCGVNSNIMFKAPKGEVVTGDSIPLTPTEAYRISSDDIITFKMFVNDGEVLLQNTQTTGQSGSSNEYLVRRDGIVNLPKIGEVNIEGKTIEECEALLVDLYSKEYKDPFVQLKIINQRVLVFPGDGGSAQVVTLENNNTTLMEVIAMAGGITDRGKANTVKLMRRVDGVRKVYVLDLSTIEGLKYVDMIVQANDYVYVEPNPELAKEVMQQVTPIIAIVSSVAVIITLINAVK